jgi:cell division protein FtsL
MSDPLEKLLLLIMALTLIVALVFIAMILHDLNDLWSALTDCQQIIESQSDKIRDLQILVISKLNIGTGI